MNWLPKHEGCDWSFACYACFTSHFWNHLGQHILTKLVQQRTRARLHLLAQMVSVDNKINLARWHSETIWICMYPIKNWTFITSTFVGYYSNWLVSNLHLVCTTWPVLGGVLYIHVTIWVTQALPTSIKHSSEQILGSGYAQYTWCPQTVFLLPWNAFCRTRTCSSSVCCELEWIIKSSLESCEWPVTFVEKVWVRWVFKSHWSQNPWQLCMDGSWWVSFSLLAPRFSDINCQKLFRSTFLKKALKHFGNKDSQDFFLDRFQTNH